MQGKTGVVRAERFKKTVESLKDDDMRGLMDSISNLDGGNYNQTSLRTFIAKAFYEVGTSKDAKNQVPRTRFTDDKHCDKDVGIVIASSAHSHWAAEGDFGVVSFLRKALRAIEEMLSVSNLQITGK